MLANKLPSFIFSFVCIHVCTHTYLTKRKKGKNLNILKQIYYSNCPKLFGHKLICPQSTTASIATAKLITTPTTLTLVGTTTATKKKLTFQNFIAFNKCGNNSSKNNNLREQQNNCTNEIRIKVGKIKTKNNNSNSSRRKTKSTTTKQKGKYLTALILESKWQNNIYQQTTNRATEHFVRTPTVMN